MVSWYRGFNVCKWGIHVVSYARAGVSEHLANEHALAISNSTPSSPYTPSITPCHRSMASNEADEELELQILGDIQDVFGSWRDDSDDDDDEAGELASDGQPTPKQRLAPSEGSQTDLTIPLLRSQTRLSKRTLAQAIASLPTDPPAKRTRGPPSAVFAPFSITDYHDRVGTFNLLNFTAAAFTSSEAALAGWSAGGRDRLKCGCCQAAWKVSDFTGLQAPARKKLAARMRAHLKESHRPSCPWRVGIDLIDKAGPSALAKAMPLRSAEIHRQADEMRPHLPAGLQLAHPLVSSATEEAVSGERSSEKPCGFRICVPDRIRQRCDGRSPSTSTAHNDAQSGRVRWFSKPAPCGGDPRRLSLAVAATTDVRRSQRQPGAFVPFVLETSRRLSACPLADGRHVQSVFPPAGALVLYGLSRA